MGYAQPVGHSGDTTWCIGIYDAPAGAGELRGVYEGAGSGGD